MSISPAAAKLADIAQLSTERRDWETALAATQDIAATDTQAAAHLVNETVGAIQRSGSNISVAAAAMPLLHAADQADGVVKVIQMQTDLSCRTLWLRPCILYV